MDDLDGRIESLESSQDIIRADLRKMDDANPRRRCRRAERKAEKVIDHYASGRRRCPSCGRRRLRAGTWKVNHKYRAAICCRCFRAVVNSKTIQDIFAINDVTYRINGMALRVARESSGLPLKVFCKLAGWSIGYQIHLETKAFELGLDKVEMIMEVLRSGKELVRQRILKMDWKPIADRPPDRHRRPVKPAKRVDALNRQSGAGAAGSS
jgi:hypothetical protein